MKSFRKKQLDCLILAGGYGKRLNPITKSIAKPLIKFNKSLTFVV